MTAVIAWLVNNVNYKVFFEFLVIVLLVVAGWICRGVVDDSHLQKILAQQKQEQVDAITKASAETAAAKQAVATIDTQRTQELQDAQRHIDDLNRRIGTGAPVLYVKSSCPKPGGGMPAAAGNTGVDTGTTRTPLDGETAAALVSITGEGDKSIVQLNACQDILESLH